ncbi:MAG: hypothetical protein ACE5HX_14470 [bacterium]
MDSTLTLIGSIVIGSLFLLGLMSFYGGVVDFSHEKTFELLAQETTASFMEIIDHDFRRMGSGLTFPATAITAIVDTTDITFLGDVDEDGAIDIVRYYMSEASAAASTPNPNDVILYRQVNGVNTIDTPAGVTSFVVKILDESGNQTGDLMAVRMLEVAITVESLYPYDGRYVAALWEKRIAPQNLYRITNTNFYF